MTALRNSELLPKSAPQIRIEETSADAWSTIPMGLFCLLASASYLAMDIHAVLRPDQRRAMLARLRTWIDTRTDQVIMVGGLILGLWLIGNSVCVMVT